MKKIVLLAALVIASLAANAQLESNKFSFGIGPSLSLPLGNFKEVSSVGIGAEVEGSYAFSENFQGFLQAGYSSFSGKSYDYGFGLAGKYPTISVVPILAGGRYVYNGLSFGAGLGYASYAATGNSAGGFTYSPQIGYTIGKIQGIVNYTTTTKDGDKSSFLGLKVFYKF
jgi:hypothetical protein